MSTLCLCLRPLEGRRTRAQLEALRDARLMFCKRVYTCAKLMVDAMCFDSDEVWCPAKKSASILTTKQAVQDAMTVHAWHGFS